MIEKKGGRARNLLNVYICLEDLFQTGNLNVFIAFSSPFYGSFPGTDRKSSLGSILIWISGFWNREYVQDVNKMSILSFVKYLLLCSCIRILKSFYISSQ